MEKDILKFIYELARFKYRKLLGYLVENGIKNYKGK